MFFAILVVALAVTARAADVRMEPSINTFSSSRWIKEQVSNENDVIKTTFVLKHDKAAMQDFEKTLYDLSTPSSKNYGKWLSVSYLLTIAFLFAYKLIFSLSSLLISARRDQAEDFPLCRQCQGCG